MVIKRFTKQLDIMKKYPPKTLKSGKIPCLQALDGNPDIREAEQVLQMEISRRHSTRWNSTPRATLTRLVFKLLSSLFL
jgi:hypothetical protein